MLSMTCKPFVSMVYIHNDRDDKDDPDADDRRVQEVRDIYNDVHIRSLTRYVYIYKTYVGMKSSGR
jgi:hypothetical protein